MSKVHTKTTKKRILSAGLVGCGNAARLFHIPAFKQVKNVSIVAYCDLDEDKAKAVAHQHGGNFYIGIDDMLEAEELDIVAVFTRESERLDPVLKALQAQKHVLCEVPLFAKRGQNSVQPDDVEAARKIMEAWKKARTVFGAVFNYRLSPHLARLKADIAAGVYGTPVILNAEADLSAFCHVIDLLRWLNGDIKELFTYKTGPEDAKHCTASLLFDNGSLGSIACTSLLSGEGPTFRIEYIGTKARGVVEDPAMSYVLRPAETKEIVLWQYREAGYQEALRKTFVDLLAAFVESIKRGNDPVATGTDALRELEIAGAMHLSAERSLPIKIERH